MEEKNIEHYLISCDLVEYDFKEVYRSFNISYFSKDANLIDNFADSQNLKDYESIEKSAKNLITILIKKFKLRFSFRKEDDFSGNIIISDDYEFDPNLISHSEYLIKIAIINEDYDKWAKSEYLKDYDFIFVSKEKLNEFKKGNSVFIFKGETVYEQIKYILNELHRRKLDKFYLFVRDMGFDNVFPKRKHYFKIFNSEFFDDQWYRDTYNIEDNTDSVVHFILIGYEKGYDPGPNFSSNEYYECNFDVKKSGMNPLLHYELYGRKEKRITRISQIHQRDYSVIKNSDYFDEEWYRNTYELANDVDLVDHYLNIGFLKRYNPSLDFSTYEYYENNLDIKEIQMNPLVHYELYGRKENKLVRLPEWRAERNYSAMCNSPYFDKEWYEKNYDMKDYDDPIKHYLEIGYIKRYDPGPNFSTSEYYECNPDVEEYGMNPLVHYEVYGRDEKRDIRLSDREPNDNS